MKSTIVIQLDENGQLAMQIVGAAQQNKIVALGMLDCVRDMILHPPKEQSPIVHARTVPSINGAL